MGRADAAQVELLRRATPLIQERLGVLSEALGKLQFLFTPDAELTVADDARAQLGADAAQVLDAAIDALAGSSRSTPPASRRRCGRPWLRGWG